MKQELWPNCPQIAVALASRAHHLAALARRSPLDDPRNSAHAWARYKRLMKWMGLLTVTVVAVTLALFAWFGDDVPIHFYIATALGIGVMMMLTAALMGLAFLSSGTGHDESVSDATDQSPRRSGDGRNR